MAELEWLSAGDRLFLDAEDSHNPMHVAGCLLFDAEPLSRAAGEGTPEAARGVDFERVCDYVESRLPKIPRYRQKLAPLGLDGRPCWVDDPDFNLLYHVRHVRLPLPGDERQLKRLCGRVISQRLDNTKPLWELWVVEGIEGGRCALITKVHHCMVDGVAGVDLLQELLRGEPSDRIGRIDPFAPRTLPGFAERVAEQVVRGLFAPLELASGAVQRLRDPLATLELGKGLWRAQQFESHPASSTPFDGTGGPHRRFDWCRIERAQVEEVRRAWGGTVNDVAIATTAGAVARYFTSQGLSSRVLRELDFRVACPVNTRALHRSSAGEDGPLGNHVSMMFAQLPLAQRAPHQRYRLVRDALDEAKQSQVAPALEALIELAGWLPSPLARTLVRSELARRPANLVFTNVPGPPVQLYLLGAPLLESYPVVPLLPGQGVGIALLSYADHLCLGFNAEWEAIPDLHDLVLATQASFSELLDAARKTTLAPAAEVPAAG